MVKGHMLRGKVAGITEHHDGKHVQVSIVHGRKSPAKKGKDSFMAFDNRPHSSLIVPKEHAGKYKLGQNVNIGVTEPDTDQDNEMGEADPMADETKDATRGLFDATRRR
jgi:hypothetical protein